MALPKRRPGPVLPACVLMLLVALWPTASAAQFSLQGLIYQLQRAGALNEGLSQSRRASTFQDRGDHARAEAPARRAYEIARRHLGPGHLATMKAQLDLARVLARIEKLEEAERHARQMLATTTSQHGAASAHAAAAQALLGHILTEQHRYDEAEKALLAAVATLRTAKPLQPDQAGNTLLVLTSVYARQGRLDKVEQALRDAAAALDQPATRNSLAAARVERGLAQLMIMRARLAPAEELFRNAIVAFERLGPAARRDLGTTMVALAQFHVWQDRMEEAESLVKRAQSILATATGPDSLDMAEALEIESDIHLRYERPAQAEAAMRRSLTIRQRSSTPNDNGLMFCLLRFADVLVENGTHLDEAEAMLKRATAMGYSRFAPGHPLLAVFHHVLGKLEVARGRYEDAIAALLRADAIVTESMAGRHTAHALVYEQLARAHLGAGRRHKALEFLVRASELVRVLNTASDSPAVSGQTVEVRPGFQLRINRRLIDVAWPSEGQSASDRERLEMGFMAAQRAETPASAKALAQMAARLSAGDGGLARLLRRSQDLSEQRAQLDRMLVASFGRGANGTQPGAESVGPGSTGAELARIAREHAAVMRQLSESFPGYMQFIGRGALTVAEAQALLAGDEALVIYHLDATHAYAWVVTRTAASWRRLELSTRQLGDAVDTLRCGLDEDAWAEPARSARCQELGLTRTPGELPIDLDTAHRLYRDLLAPFEQMTRGRSLLIVPSGVLAALPFHVLVTRPVTGTGPAALREAAWLIREQAAIVLPAVQSLRWLRTSPASAATRPLIGFGAPVFGPLAIGAAERTRGARMASEVSRVQPFVETRTETGALAVQPPPPRPRTPQPARPLVASASASGVDLASLRRGLVPLPETEMELRMIAERLAAPASDVILGARASEATIKQTALRDYRIVYFATHALTAGEVAGLNEPALALTLPERPSPADDGLLTASEIAQLSLDADWVVLSACNTAAGDRPGAEALSGLARSFFYAGARSLLVSHWKVDSGVAIFLTTGTFNELAKDPSITRGEALRRAMLRLLAAGNEKALHPSYWAPFFVVGDGARRQ